LPVRPQREAQSYCSRDCRRAAAYGRERFKNGTKARRKRRLEASDKLPATLVAGSFRNGDFPQLKQGATTRRIGSKNSISVTPTKSIGRTGLARSANGLSTLWAALDTALGGKRIPWIRSCVRPSSTPNAAYSRTTSRPATPWWATYRALIVIKMSTFPTP